MIKINGQTYHGNNLTIINGKVLIDGKPVDAVASAPIIKIDVLANISSLSVDACESVRVIGTVGNVATVSGDISCQGVSGNVSSVSGDINCGDIGGSVSTISGDVNRK